MKKLLILMAALALTRAAAGAQGAAAGMPAVASAAQVQVVQQGKAQLPVLDSARVAALQQGRVTLAELVRQDQAWNARQARRVAAGDATNVTGNADNHRSILDCYWVVYKYPSVNSEGQPVTLSALAYFPDGDEKQTNNVIIGCHCTVTSNAQVPWNYYKGQWNSTSSQAGSGKWTTDIGMMMYHATSGVGMTDNDADDMAYYDIVIEPDYEGYGLTASKAHPYLYEELTARQVVDATRYGLALYKTMSYSRPMRSGWKSIAVGYSQGGSVALAVQRFIEQYGLDQELQLGGSVCGDGPYDPVATLRYYVRKCKASSSAVLSMPVVLPLILKGMVDSNPYMKTHKIEDYLSAKFLSTGIVGWIEGKTMSTSDITDQLKALHKQDAYKDWIDSDGKLSLRDALTPLAYNYFINDANFKSLPTTRGVMQDLHLALESNDLSQDWTPRYPICFFHSTDDTVVPYDNFLSCADHFNTENIFLIQNTSLDHVPGGTAFFATKPYNPENDMIRKLANGTQPSSLAPYHKALTRSYKENLAAGYYQTYDRTK